MRLNGFAASLALTLYPDDERWGQWSQDELETMNTRFVAAMETAFQSGQEHRESAAAQVKLPVNSGPRFVAPLCPATSSGLFRSVAPDTLVFVTRR
jgi:hypothetical protein